MRNQDSVKMRFGKNWIFKTLFFLRNIILGQFDFWKIIFWNIRKIDLNPFSHGGGTNFAPPSGNAYRDRFGWSDCLETFLTSKICQFFNIWWRKKNPKRGGDPPSSPLKEGTPKKWPPHDCIWPPFFVTKMDRYIEIIKFGKN